MSLTDDYLKAKNGTKASTSKSTSSNKKKKTTSQATSTGQDDLLTDYLRERERIGLRSPSQTEIVAKYSKPQKPREEEEEDEAPWYEDLVEFGRDFLEQTLSRRTGGNLGEALEERREGKTEERTWFQKGAFEDGYDFGDITKTILGTTTDVLDNVGAGLIGIGEKAVDASLYFQTFSAPVTALRVAGRLGSEKADEIHQEIQNQTANFIAKDLYDEEAVARWLVDYGTTPGFISKIFGLNAEDESLLGEKVDSLAQSGGQLLGQAGLQAVGVPWFVTSALTSFGSEAEVALNEGASFDEAGIRAGITAAADVLTEKLSGAISFGGKTADQGLTTLLARGISNDFVRTGLKLGYDFVSEGGEEVLASAASRFGEWLTKSDEKTWREIMFSQEALHEYSEAFLGGGVFGGGFGAFNAVTNRNVDYTSGLTADEKAVVDAVYEARLAEEGDLSPRQKNQLYDSVVKSMERGEIPTDTIEGILGGDTYNTYRETANREDAILGEFAELGKKANATLAEQARYSELAPQVNSIKANSNRNDLARQVRTEAFERVKDTRLAESYRERVKRGQAYQADVSKYDAKQQRVIQKAIDSGVLNDTRKTHDFVDLVARISADKGIDFDFTNNNNLRGSGFAVEGHTVNGFVHNGTITVNIDSRKSLNTVVGHEITHVLEGTELYDTLRNTLYAYAESKGVDINARLNAIAQTYSGINANADAELTADLVGEYLFTDTDFIKRLSTQNRNVFEKIYDEIKYFFRKATAGSQEKRDLEKVKKAFEEAYRADTSIQDGEKSLGSDGPHNTLPSDSDGRQFANEIPLEKRLSGDDLLDAEDLIAEIKDVAEISPNGYVTVYHRTTEENAKRIIRSGKMSAKEDGIFFSTQKNGEYSSDYGNGIVELRVPVEKFVLDDIFDAEAHLRIPLTSRNAVLNISEYLTGSDTQFSLSEMGEHPVRRGNYNVFGEDVLIDPTVNEEIAPVAEQARHTNPVIDKKPTDNKPADEKPINTKKVQKFVEKSGNHPLVDWAKEHLLDNGMVFEDLGKAAGNRELEAKWNFIRNAPVAAQNLIGEGDKANGVKSLESIMSMANKAGKADAFDDYLLHMHNIDRMTLSRRIPGAFDKTVWEGVTAEDSRLAVYELLSANPEFSKWSGEVYKFNEYLRDMMVEAGIITQETADLWAEMYPHYVPIYRVGKDGKTYSESGHLVVNSPVKRATGGNGEIMNVLEAMAARTVQTYKAVAKNNFGVELKNTLGTIVEHGDYHLDEFTEGFDMDTMFGQLDGAHTYTVYENGQRTTFEITDAMYEAMRPRSEVAYKRIPVVSHISNIFRGLTTQYNPLFALTNPIKDVQEVLLNSQHPARTYGNIVSGRTVFEMVGNGKYYQEYVKNGGKTNTYFDNESNTFKKENIAKRFLDKVFFFNDYIEMTPRLAEYIASRESGKSVEGAMLDAARVTTNFAAGGDVTKFFNRNGCTFLNASVQGAVQQVRNVREANQKGLMGYVGLATRWAIGGLAPVLLNNLMWDDDDEYEELADYVKENYYVVGKYDDGRFIRIPKGRALAVLQEAMELVMDIATGDDEVDMARFQALGALAISNLAPNNPLENNIIAPIGQVIANRTWYGEDLVPSRLQDLPAGEQYDEKTDSISRWLAESVVGEFFDWSPYKINYLLNQYSGGIGDFFLPMLTPRAESGDDSTWGTLLAPFRDKFTTDSVLNSQTVTDFYDTQDELEIRANSREATEEDKFMYMYMRSIGYETGDLYARKREIQGSDLPDSEKYEQVREIQEEINALMEEALSSYSNPHIDGLYAEVGDRRYNYDSESGNWYEIKPENADGTDNWYYQKEQEVTQGLGISYGEYWNNREEYNFAYDYPSEYEIANACGGYNSYIEYRNALYDIKADKDSDGNSISGSRKPKVLEYINSLDIEWGMKLILFKNQYNADDTYNYEIIDYLNSRDDISYAEMETILKELGFEVDSEGYITWD